MECSARKLQIKVNQAVKQRREARDAVRQFKIHNLIAGRQPQVHDKILVFKVMCTVCFIFY